MAKIEGTKLETKIVVVVKLTLSSPSSWQSSVAVRLRPEKSRSRDWLKRSNSFKGELVTSLKMIKGRSRMSWKTKITCKDDLTNGLRYSPVLKWSFFGPNFVRLSNGC